MSPRTFIKHALVALVAVAIAQRVNAIGDIVYGN
jgi:hypothetical protein